MLTASIKLISKFQDEDFEVGEIVNAITSITSDGTNRIMILATADKGGLHTKFYDTLLDFSEDWKFYEKPKEPLIKDPKIRKAVRAWAEANDIERVWHECASCCLRGNGLTIEMENEVDELEQGNYSTTELCGEEKRK